jgi:hypothetical protein
MRINVNLSVKDIVLMAGPAVVVAGLLFTPACDSSDEEEFVPAETVRVSDVPADPATGRDPATGAPTGTTGRFAFYSLRSNEIVLPHTEANRTDSSTTGWDIAFRATTILVNGGNAWGGQGGAMVVDQAFDDVMEAPASGYTTDPIGLSGSDRTWYVYDPQAMTVFPRAPRTLVIKTADGMYAKVGIVSYYQGAPAVPNPFADQDRYYTFDFALQTDGSRTFQ